MTEDFISMRDKILLSAVELISDAGIQSLTTRNVARRVNTDVSMLYKYYADMNELLRDVCEYYFRFDEALFKTAGSRAGSCLDKLRMFFEAYATYYDNFYALSVLCLHMEELLHNTETRDIVMNGLLKRKGFVNGLVRTAMEKHEIRDDLLPEEVTDLCFGYFHIAVLNRRIGMKEGLFKAELAKMEEMFIRLLS